MRSAQPVNYSILNKSTLDPPSHFSRRPFILYVLVISISLYSMYLLQDFVKEAFNTYEPEDLTLSEYIWPLFNLLGTLAGGFLMEKGRRKMILWSNVVFAIAIGLMYVDNTPTLLFVTQQLLYVLNGFILVATVIFCQEIMPKAALGVSLSISFSFSRVSHLVSTLVIVILRSHRIGRNEQRPYYLYLIIHVAALQIFQVLLLLFKYKAETPPFLVEHESSEEALIELKAFYKNSQDSYAVLQSLKKGAEFKKFQSISWLRLFGKEFRKPLIAGMLLVFCAGLSGMYLAQIQVALSPTIYVLPFSCCATSPFRSPAFTC